jgi:hypothetical protein
MLRDDPAARPTMTEVAASLAAITAGQPPTNIGPATVAMPPPTRLDLQPLSTAPTAGAPPHARTPPAGAGRRTTYTVLGLLSAGLLALLLVTLLTTPRDRTGGATGAAPPNGATSSASQPPAPDPALLVQAVTDYYTFLPEHADRAWTRLGPNLHAQDREQYEEFWKDVKDLTIVTPPQTSGNTVTVQIEYTMESRGRIRETHQHAMDIHNGTALINSDQVLSSQTTKGDDDKQDKKKEEEGNGEGGGN